MSARKITATLRDAKLYGCGDATRVTGAIYGDAAKRFDDGEEIHTTRIIGFDNIEKLIFTKNSTYRLEPWEDLVRCPCCDEVWPLSKAGDPKPRDATRELLMMRDDLPD